MVTLEGDAVLAALQALPGGEKKFTAMPTSEIAQIIGRKPERGPDGTLVLRDEEPGILGAACAVLDALAGVREPKLRRAILRDAVAHIGATYGPEAGTRIAALMRERGNTQDGHIRRATADELFAVLGREPSMAGAAPLTAEEDKLITMLVKFREAVVPDDENLFNQPSRQQIYDELLSIISQTEGILEKRRILRAGFERAQQYFDAKTQDLRREQTILRALGEWGQNPFTLQRPENGSTFHKLKQAWTDKTLCIPWLDTDDPLKGDPFARHGQVFVVEHDWAAAFQSATDFAGGEWKLPFDDCVFEFKVSGARVIMSFVTLAHDPRDDISIDCWCCIQTPSGWILPWLFDLYDGRLRAIHSKAGDCSPVIQTLMDFLLRQIRAVCISLDAEVATTEIVRAPHKLNAIREKKGKLPLYDFHVVTLNRKPRPAPLPRDELDPDREIARRRLHFRRGHWRHYESHKTWISWMLVGDPDLGFVDKHYKL